MKFLLALLLSTAIIPRLLAQIIIDPKEYSFPKSPPLTAAVSTAFVGVPNGSWILYKIPFGKRRVRNFKDDERIAFRYLWPKKNRDRNELVYVLAGFGADTGGGKQNYLARQLAENGFHVVILPSIFTRQFIVAASEEGIVGEFSRDAWDYFKLMEKATDAVERSQRTRFSKTHMIGYSYGALTAAFVARIDKREKRLKLDKEVLINPPTDLLAAARTLDNYYQERYRMGLLGFARLLSRVGLRSLYYRRYIPTESLYRSFINGIPLSLPQQKALVGEALRAPLPEAYAAVKDALWSDHGSLMGVKPVLPAPVSFKSYMENALLSYNRFNQRPRDTLEKINARNSLYALEEYFRANDNVFLVHNRDDFLIQPGDIAWFASCFGDRFVLYPWGGHLGNLWHAQNVKGLVSLLLGGPRRR